VVGSQVAHFFKPIFKSEFMKRLSLILLIAYKKYVYQRTSEFSTDNITSENR